MKRVSKVFTATLSLCACVYLAATDTARAEATKVKPMQLVVGNAALEPSSRLEGRTASSPDGVRYALNTTGSTGAQLQLSDDKKWRYSVTPYLWAVGLDGDMTIMGVESNVDVGFDDLLDNADFAFSVHLEAQRGPWGLFFDPTYAKLSMDGTVGATRVDAEFEFALIEIGAFYRLIDRDLGSSGRFHLVTEPLVGLRWTYLGADIDFSGGPPIPDQKDNQDWLDLMVGWRAHITLAPRWTLNTRTDFGGFGIGTSSDFTMNSQILFGYQMNKRATLLFGYRSMDQDFERGSGGMKFGYDITTSGPVIGTKIQF